MKTLRVADKIALVTGGSRGMGASHARLLSEHGAAVIVGDVLDEEGEATVRDLGGGSNAQYVSLDVTDEGSWARAVAEVEQSLGPINILVNNAGVAGTPGGLEIETPAEWTRTLAVNQTGAYLGMRAVVPSMKRAGGGSIVNISSVLGFVGDADYFAYNATKGALRTMTRSAALKFAADGIRVNTICPGLIRTPMNDAEEDPDAYVDSTPLGRIGEPIEVSYAVLFLASDEASYITGSDVVVDGGYLAK
jgi:NAD(P)-dependent dehydrogenase (short-subunit alcohol dehydrogenase family)